MGNIDGRGWVSALGLLGYKKPGPSGPVFALLTIINNSIILVKSQSTGLG